MIAEKDAAEYRALCGVLGVLRESYLEKREEVRRLLEETFVLKKKALLMLVKANGLTRHLTGRQRQISGVSYRLGEMKQRLRRLKKRPGPAFFEALAGGESGETSGIRELASGAQSYPKRKNSGAGLAYSPAAAFLPETCLSPGELKKKGLAVLRMIEEVKKGLLRFSLLEQRCRELLLSIGKAVEAFRYEFGIIRGKLYPGGVLSRFRRSLRGLLGSGYFSAGDMKEISALGNITGCVLQIAGSPGI